MKIWLIDHYDSFTNNVAAWLEADARVEAVEIVRFDDADRMHRVLIEPRPVVLSPGPGTPLEATPTIQLLEPILGEIPVLGICLGHQILAHMAGLNVKPVEAPIHGVTREVFPVGKHSMFAFRNDPFAVGIYHSLAAFGEVTSDDWIITARDSQDAVMGLRYKGKNADAWGWQFHPESFLSADSCLRSRWIDECIPSPKSLFDTNNSPPHAARVSGAAAEPI